MTGMFAERQRRAPSVVLVLLLALPFLAVPAELPPEIQADLYLVQAQRQIQAGEHGAAAVTLDKIVKLQRDHGLAVPPAFWFKHAQASLDAARFEQAVDSATRYLTEAGRRGQYYMAALGILDETERALEAQRKREAEDRAYQERFEAAEERSRTEGTFADPLRSGGNGPEMVVIPAGEFRMGCRGGFLSFCEEASQPVHEVSIPQPFAVSTYEVTFEQWDVCVSTGGCNDYRVADESWGRGNRPVINVSWEDAQAYVSWLSGETGRDYRLPSESEWEYAARAGTKTWYFWGNDEGNNRANCMGYCGNQWNGVTAPVGSFAANAFGVYDMHGNVGEWVEDCWNDSYQGAPLDGSAWTSGDCSTHVMRGGSWSSHPHDITAWYRGRETISRRSPTFGFRVARTLAP